MLAAIDFHSICRNFCGKSCSNTNLIIFSHIEIVSMSIEQSNRGSQQHVVCIRHRNTHATHQHQQQHSRMQCIVLFWQSDITLFSQCFFIRALDVLKCHIIGYCVRHIVREWHMRYAIIQIITMTMCRRTFRYTCVYTHSTGVSHSHSITCDCGKLSAHRKALDWQNMQKLGKCTK